MRVLMSIQAGLMLGVATMCIGWYLAPASDFNTVHGKPAYLVFGLLYVAMAAFVVYMITRWQA